MVRRARVEGESVSAAAGGVRVLAPVVLCRAGRAGWGGLAGLVPARPGPKRAHKMTGEVVAFARERRAVDPKLSSQALVELIAERFGVRVHRRSVERALARAERAEQVERGEESEDDRCERRGRGRGAL